MKKLIFTLVLLMTFQVFAQAPILSPGLSSEDLAIREKARRKLYPGGSDEEPLKVQAQLPILKSKFEMEEEPAPIEDAD